MKKLTMKLRMKNLSPETLDHIDTVSDYLTELLGVDELDRTAVLDGIVRGHKNLTQLTGVDAGLFAQAIEHMVSQDDGQWLRELVARIGMASGYWETGADRKVA